MSAARRAPEAAADRLRRRLLALDYPAFARCVCVLMEALGYERARLAGRREWKGYNRPGGGGWDIEAILPGGIAPRRVVAQIKQFGELRVHQRNVDEIRGACLRAGASEALLVTTSAFSSVARRSAEMPSAAAALAAPVRLIDSKALTTLMIQCRLGVREQARGSARRLEIDEAFFADMASPCANPKAMPIRPAPVRRCGNVRISKVRCSAPCRNGLAKEGR